MLKESLFQENAVTQIKWQKRGWRKIYKKARARLHAVGRREGDRNDGRERLPVWHAGARRFGAQIACGRLQLHAMLIHS